MIEPNIQGSAPDKTIDELDEVDLSGTTYDDVSDLEQEISTLEGEMGELAELFIDLELLLFEVLVGVKTLAEYEQEVREAFEEREEVVEEWL